MDIKLGKCLAAACGLAALLALGGCGERDEQASAGAQGSAAGQAAAPSGDAAQRDAAQRSGTAELAQGGGT